MLSECGVEAITSALLKINHETHTKYFVIFTILSKIFALTSCARFLTDNEVKTLCDLCAKFGEYYSKKFVEDDHTIFNKVLELTQLAMPQNHFQQQLI